jgi:hypothetical protein
MLLAAAKVSRLRSSAEEPLYCGNHVTVCSQTPRARATHFRIMRNGKPNAGRQRSSVPSLERVSPLQLAGAW